MTFLGVDFGRRRVGLARGSSDSGLATPWKTLEVRGRDDALRRLEEVVRAEGVDRVVFGLPCLPSGDEGDAARRVRRIADVLATRTAVPVDFEDEYASTEEARELLRSSGARIGIDTAAATVILQAYLTRTLNESA